MYEVPIYLESPPRTCRLFLLISPLLRCFQARPIHFPRLCHEEQIRSMYDVPYKLSYQ